MKIIAGQNFLGKAGARCFIVPKAKALQILCQVRAAIAFFLLWVPAACSGALPWSNDRSVNKELTMPSVDADASLAATTVHVTEGWLVGYQNDKVRIFKGIPYAAPPVGSLRWKPPQPVEPWVTPRNAQSFGFDCLQNRPKWDKTLSAMAMNEDCLTLNIWTPVPDSSEERFPVMVFIHGGGFVIGSASQPMFDGYALSARGAVIVSFNYRIGRFGFFSHPQLTEESGGEAVANFGIMDQIAALRWVRDNIAKFGGDPENVTIFGESAGGASVAHLMIIESAQGLFHKAVIQSGGGRLKWGSFDPKGEDPGAEAAGLAFVKTLRRGNIGLDELRALSADEILGDVSFSKLRSKTYSGPVIDGRLIKAEFIEQFEAGAEAKMPLLIGANSAELSHMGFLPQFFIRRAIKKGLKAQLSDLKDAYGSAKRFDENIINHWGFVEPARTMAIAHTEHGGKAYLYEFDYVLASQAKKLKGAPHASELPFVFDTLASVDASPSPEDEAIADLMADAWVSFARTGVPQLPEQGVWDAYDPEQDQRVTITANGAAPKTVSDAPALDVLASIGRVQH